MRRTKNTARTLCPRANLANAISSGSPRCEILSLSCIIEETRHCLQNYDKVHIPLSIAVCLFGTFSNVANIIVLTRKQMRTPINVLLTGLSIAQLLLASNYFGLLTVEYFRMRCHRLPWTLHVAWYRLINVNLNVVFHTTAFAHTIVVAVFRFAALRWPIQANRFIYRCELAVIASAIIWAVVPLICTPVFLSSQVWL